MRSIGKGIGVPFRMGGGQSWSSYWTPQTAVVANAAPTDVVLTYANKVNPTDAIAGNFTIAGKTISTATLDATGKVLTLVVSVAFVYGDSIVVVANSTNIVVTNNVAATAELTTYIAGLVTHLSLGQRRKINEFVKSLKTGLGIANLSDAFDFMYLLAGETSESSLKNLVKDAHHATVEGTAPTFTANRGFQNSGNGFIDTQYNPKTQGVIVTAADASYGIYLNSDVNENSVDMGIQISTTHHTFISSRLTNIFYTRLNNDQAMVTNPSNSNSVGMFITTRDGTAYTDLDTYINKNTYTKRSGTTGVTDNPNGHIYILACNIDGSPTLYSTRQASFAFAGKFLTEAERDIIVDAFDVYFLRYRDFTSMERYASNPIIGYGDYDWRIAAADVPYIKSDQKIGVNYYAFSQVSNGDWDWLDLALYSSTDLLNWNPVGTQPVISCVASTWEDHWMLHPCTIKIGSLWHTYYTARNAANLGQLGLATSPDLITWTKYPTNPIYTAPTGNVDAVCVIQIGAIYYLYYYNNLTANNSILYATSNDGITWTYGGVCWVTVSSDFDYGYSSLDPWVVQRSDGIYEMAYTYADFSGGNNIQRIAFANSIDGISWRKYKSILTEEGVGWEALLLGNPIIFNNADGSSYLYYCGVPATPFVNCSGGLAIIPAGSY